ncbi:MAG: chemotaxis-specific protein-glutamate methyltransferase CheB [Fibrobacterota bacterium]
MLIRTLVVDDTVLFRKLISEASAAFPGVEVVGTAASGAIALKKLHQSPVDLVLLDVHMADMDGVQTLEHIRLEFPDTAVVMVSGVSTRSADSTIRALELSALDFIRKPDSSDYQENVLRLREDLKNVFRSLETRMLTRGLRKSADAPLHDRPLAAPSAAPGPPHAPAVDPATSHRLPDTLDLVVLGVSTGGPEALSRVIPALPADLGVPVVLVQHMPPHFTRSLAESLGKKSALEVVEAVSDGELRPGRVYIAPGGQHLVVREHQGRLYAMLNADPPENSCRPSVDVLFRSVAGACGDRGVLAVILTGMGSDGLRGVEALKKKKCYCLTQNEATCVVYGMPRAVDDARFSDESLPVSGMAARITEIVRHCHKRI